MQRSHIDKWMELATGISPLTREALEAYQLDQINFLLSNAKEKSRYYSYLPSSVTTFEEFKKIPYTTGAQLESYSSQMVLVSQSEVSRIINMDTSGTEGPSKRLYFTQEDQELTIDFFTCGLSELVSAGDHTLICMPGRNEDSLGPLIARAILRLGAIPVLLGVGKSMEELLDVIQKAAITNIVAFPMHMLSLGRFAKARNVPVLLKSLLISADSCPGWITDELKRTFDCDVFIHYGSRESGLGGAVDCSAHDGMHVREKDLYMEIIDEAGKEVPKGCRGELVITTLHRAAMPLIRYCTGDYTSFLPELCPCGSKTLRIDRIVRKQGLAMQSFDQSVFSAKEVIDSRITRNTEGLLFDILVSEDIDKRHFYQILQPIADSFFPDERISISIHCLEVPENMPYYLEKRRIIEKRG